MSATTVGSVGDDRPFRAIDYDQISTPMVALKLGAK